ncbi:MAG: hypothetical protein AB8B55_24245 [Mariniblastus sp.]
MKSKISQSVHAFVALLVLSTLVGCGSTRDADFVKASNDSNIKKMGSAYQLYAARFGYTGPESKEELKSFLKENDSITENLKLIGLERDKIDDYFVSENDGQEFDFRWKVFINPDKDRTSEPLVFEKQGQNGVRLVMLSNRKILEVDDDKKYNTLLNGTVDSEEGKTDLEKEEEGEGDPELDN